MDGWMILLAALATVAGSYGASRYAGRATVKVKELDVDGQAYIRAQGINAEIVEALRSQITDLNGRLDSVEKEVKEVRDHNNALIRYCYRLVDILRGLGHGDKIPTPPPSGIHI
jgi:TolA-binding protein